MPPSSLTPVSLATAIGAAIARWQDATQLFDDEVGERLGLSRSERQCLACIAFGARPAREIADATRLTRAAVTTLIDRLEARGLVKRSHDDTDRRQIRVALTPKAERLTAQFYGPIAEEGARWLATFSPDELTTILKFVDGASALQMSHIDRIRRRP